MARIVAAIIVALLLSAQVVRQAGVSAYGEIAPARASRFWAGHPAAQLSQGLSDIAAQTAARRPVSPATLASILDASRKAPLAPQPFLVRGIEAQLAGDQQLAEKAFEAARLRDGRSIPARYFLADLYLRTGKVPSGLRELAILSRMIPMGTASLAPYLASYAQDRNNWPELRSLFRADPNLANAVLGKLARDSHNAPTVLALAQSLEIGGRPAPWTIQLLSTLVDDGQYAEARRIWLALAPPEASGESLIYDPGFNGSTAPPPFNWTLMSSTVGLAESEPGGRLHVQYYGQEDGVLASQLLLLPSGTYRLSMNVSGDVAHADSLSWTVTCEGSDNHLLSLGLGDAKAAASGIAFQVPPDCPAQKLALLADAPELPQRVDVTIGDVNLTRTQPHG